MSMSDHNPGECAAGECALCLREENARLKADETWLDRWFQNAFPDWQTVVPPEGVPLRHFLLDRLVHERFEAREENARLRAALMDVLASAQPTEQEHPAMWSAWINARAALAPEVKP